MRVYFPLLMECLYCHKKFSTFRFWKSSEFCSEEHAEAYRSQTLNRLMDGGGRSEKPPPAFEDAVRMAAEPAQAGPPQIAPPKHAGALQIEAPAARSSAPDTGALTLPPAGTHALEADARLGELRSEAGRAGFMPSRGLSSEGAGDVDLQTPEEALNALRELARGSDRPTARPSLPSIPDLPPPVQEQPKQLEEIEQPVAEREPGGAKDDDTDDVFAELRRMVEATGKAEQEDEEEAAIDPPSTPEGFSAFDRLMETQGSSVGVGRPRLDRRDGAKDRVEEPRPTFAAAKQETPVEAKADHEETPEEPPAAAAVEKQDEPEPVVAQAEKKAPDKEAAEKEKVVSFPGRQQAPGQESGGRRPVRMARPRGATSGLFDSGIHEELMTVDVTAMLRDASGLPIKRVALVLDERLRAPRAESCAPPIRTLKVEGAAGADWPPATDVLSILPPAHPSSMLLEMPVMPDAALWEAPAATFAPRELAFVAPDRALEPVRQWHDLVSDISLRDLGGNPEFVVEQQVEPRSSAIEPHLPVGLAESMGVVPPNRGQLIRSELFIKEPEVREYALEAYDPTPVADVRRAYYGRQGTA